MAGDGWRDGRTEMRRLAGQWLVVRRIGGGGRQAACGGRRGGVQGSGSAFAAARSTAAVSGRIECLPRRSISATSHQKLPCVTHIRTGVV